MKEVSNLFSLEGRTILLTGASGHLGSEIARGILAQGASLIVTGRDWGRLDALVASLPKGDGDVEPVVGDLSEPESRARLVGMLRERPLHGIVNNAYSGAAGSMLTSSADDFHRSYDITVVAAHALMRDCHANLRRAATETGDASVVNVSTMYATVSPDPRVYASPEVANPPFYGAAKAGLLALTRYAACEFGPDRIRVNSISPGPFPSPDAQQASPELMAKLVAKTPLGRIGRPEEVVGAAVFLLSRAASYITGADLAIDGGWTSW